LDFSPLGLGQSCPTHCPSSAEGTTVPFPDLLGAPLTIGEVARIIGCSVWTVRQKYLALGLPHHRASVNGKLIFYQNQVIRWLVQRQQKGGTNSP
jgi:hypothetical protein